MLKKIVIVAGRAFTLSGNDIDTDRIIPARFLKCVTFQGLGEHVFEDDRAQLKGAHPFDQSFNQGCNVLLVGENFGSGSSREHAVPALTQWGIQAIIGLSFAAIFRGNAVGNGLVCVTVTPSVHRIIEQQISIGAKSVSVDLEQKIITIECETGTSTWECDIPESDRQSLMTGNWDDLAICLEAGELIETTAARLPYFIPVIPADQIKAV